MHSHPARIYVRAAALLGVVSINTSIIASQSAISGRDNSSRTANAAMGYAYFNICVERSPPFAVHATQGADISLIKVLRERLIGVHHRSRTRILPPSPPASAAHHCDMVLANALDLRPAAAAALIGSDVYHVDTLLLCAAKRHSKDEWLKLRTITITQLSMVVPFAFYTAVTYYVGRQLIQPDKFQNLYIIFTAYFRILCTVPNSQRLLPTELPLRLLYTAWLLYCFVISVNYSTLVLRVFKKQLYTPQIFNIQQAEDEQVNLYTLSAFNSRMNYTRTFDCKTIEECLGILKATEQTEANKNNIKHGYHVPRSTRKKNNQKTNTNTMIALPATIMKYHRRNFMVFGESTIHCFEHPTAFYKRRILVRRNPGANGSWNITALNRLLIRINRSGLYDVWIRWVTKPEMQVQHNYHKDSTATARKVDIHPNASTIAQAFHSLLQNLFSDDFGPSGNSIALLSYKDFVLLYAYLLIGVCGATLGFLGEHVYYYFKHS